MAVGDKHGRPLLPAPGLSLQPGADRFHTEAMHGYRIALLAENADVLLAVFERSPEAVVVVGSDLRVCRVNAAAERLFRTGRADLVGSDLGSFGIRPGHSSPDQ